MSGISRPWKWPPTWPPSWPMPPQKPNHPPLIQSAPGSAPNSELRWAPVDGAKIAANPFQPGEFVELGESISEGLYSGPGSSSGAASTTETSADASFHDFLRLVSESPSSHWREPQPPHDAENSRAPPQLEGRRLAGRPRFDAADGPAKPRPAAGIVPRRVGT